MAAFDTSRTAYGSTTAATSVFSFISKLAGNVVDWNDARLTRNALSSLSDRELEDIGLIRGDIDSVAKSTALR
jgi:uncharacterized protein YjiS (DUF1127 family)